MERDGLHTLTTRRRSLIEFIVTMRKFHTVPRFVSNLEQVDTHKPFHMHLCYL